VCQKTRTPAFTVTRLQGTTTVMTCLAIQREDVSRRHTAVDITPRVQNVVLLHGHRPGDFA